MNKRYRALFDAFLAEIRTVKEPVEAYAVALDEMSSELEDELATTGVDLDDVEDEEEDEEDER